MKFYLELPRNTMEDFSCDLKALEERTNRLLQANGYLFLHDIDDDDEEEMK